jgi:hypothetical protein
VEVPQSSHVSVWSWYSSTVLTKPRLQFSESRRKLVDAPFERRNCPRLGLDERLQRAVLCTELNVLPFQFVDAIGAPVALHAKPLMDDGDARWAARSALTAR